MCCSFCSSLRAGMSERTPAAALRPGVTDEEETCRASAASMQEPNALKST
jgi:hypothetical protein